MIAVFFSLYAGLIAPQLPEYVLDFLDNPYVKFILIFILAYSSQKDPTLALIATIGLVVSIQALNKIKLGKLINSMVDNASDIINMRYNRNNSLLGGESQEVMPSEEFQ